MIRIVTIGTFLKKNKSEYEIFVFLTREKGANPFIFEIAALHGSSFVFNIVLIGISFTDIGTEWIPKAYLLSGIFGILITSLSWIFYTMRVNHITNLALK